jgi:hypothetical protein
MTNAKPTLLFICVHNAGRSQLCRRRISAALDSLLGTVAAGGLEVVSGDYLAEAAVEALEVGLGFFNFGAGRTVPLVSRSISAKNSPVRSTTSPYSVSRSADCSARILNSVPAVA